MAILSRRPRAFTLIELLVVIAIISILAAILFPVFAQAKAAAKNAAGLAGEKQILTGTALYSGDNDSVFCPADIWRDGDYENYNITGDWHSWVEVTNPYVKSRDAWFNPVQSREVTDYDVAFSGRFPNPRKVVSTWVWPAWMPFAKRMWYDNVEKYMGIPIYRNKLSEFYDTLDYWCDERGAQPAELNSVPYPAELTFIIQGMMTASFPTYRTVGEFGTAPGVWFDVCDGEDPFCAQGLGEEQYPKWFKAMYPYRKSTNVGFADGHVKNIGVKRLHYDRSMTHNGDPLNAFMRAGG
ncbi:prepilin-type N-terminal cleavage/methylation domain-containing protein [bacterium]|nr:MAG: prepilin-type N-terminal cleavage/methylation domain-containing protein [bacterium]